VKTRYEAMISVLITLSAAIGTNIALLRGRVYLVMGASAVFALVIAACGAALGHSLGISMLTGFGAVVAVQASYVTLRLALELFAAESFIPEVQHAIGRQLRSEFKPPRDLPAPLVNLVQQLRAA
jgi:hypothetical protein